MSFLRFYQFKARKHETVPDDNEGTYISVGYSAQLVNEVLKRSGFRLVDDFLEANLIIGCELSENQFLSLKPHQKYSHYVNTFDLGTKSGYHKIMKSLEQKIGQMPPFYPETYSLPDENNAFIHSFSTHPKWIIKPSGGSRGEGIEIVDTLLNVDLDDSLIAQKYILNPMLIDGRKFDLRFYVALTSVDPLRVYVYDNGIVRIASDVYANNPITQKSAHLTNFSINKSSENFIPTNDMCDDGKGNKWSFAPLWPYLEAQGIDAKLLRNRIEDAFTALFIASRDLFIHQVNHRQSFELFGIDVMLDTNGNFFILEVNVSPALGVPSRLDLEIKGPLVKDFFNIALIPHKQSNNVENNINEYEEVQKIHSGFRILYPTKDRIVSHSMFFAHKTKPDIELECHVNCSND